MRISKTIRTLAVGAACVVALAGLVSQGISWGGVGSIDQDFIVLNQAANQNSEKSAQAETLNDWQFTVRTRPVKCRFVD